VSPWSTRETRSLPACPESRRRGLGIARRGAEARPLDVAMVDQGNVVAPSLPGVLDVEAWESLGVERKLGRSTWHVVDQGNVVASLSTRSLDVEASGSLGVGRSSAVRCGTWSTRGTWLLPCLPGVATSRPRDRSTGS
jgi:hypothetical protein